MQRTITRRHFAFLWIWGLSAIILCACMPAAHASLFGVSEQEEIEAGQQVRQQAYKEYGKPLPDDNPMSRRVRVIGERFAALSSRKNIPYTYQVLDNDKVLNAFAAPGGPIFITKKLMDTVSNDAELAYVLGHETTHIDHKHIVKAVEKQQKVGLGVGILGSIFGYGNSDLFNIFSNVAFTVWSQGYSRDQESEADHQGVIWMSELGFDPNAAITMLRKLDSGSSSGLDKYLSSHPDPKAREKAVEKLITEQNLAAVARKAGGPSLSAYGLPAFRGVSKNFAQDPYGPKIETVSGITGNSTNTASGMLMSVPSDNGNIILVAVRPFAEWAGADIHVDGTRTTLTLAKRTVELRTNSRIIRIDGKTTSMRVAARVYQGSLYAPIGDVADGIGGTVAWDGKRHGVTVAVGNKKAFWALDG